MGCRLPGGDGLEEFWRLVSEGGVAWGELPEERFSRELYYADGKGKTGKSYSELGGLVSDRPVDATSCPLSPELSQRYDIAHQIFLEVASKACRDAGFDPFAMPQDRLTGVYVGHTGGSPLVGDHVYSTRIEQASELLNEIGEVEKLLGDEATSVVGDLAAAVRSLYPGRQPGRRQDLSALGAARIVREALRLEGPYLVVDAACASSLQALAIAGRALAAGSIDQAIVGGASFCKSDSLVLFSAAQSVSNTGSCPFGQDADGLVAAEGYVALVLKTLSRAVADGDRIRALIRGIGVASDGKGKSLWAPRQEGQTLAVERAYPQLSDLANLEYIEAHATSTQVGDATELNALAGLLGQQLPPGRRVPIGSVKANVGHTLETAGLASLVKVVLALEHDKIPPGTTATKLNEQFDWQESPFRVPLTSESWPGRSDGRARQAAVNAFGIGGLNVHIALSEYLPPRVPIHTVAPVSTANEPIAIVGAGCVLPAALNLEAFIKLLDSGQTAIRPVPSDRWNCSRVLDPSRPQPWHTTGGVGGFIDGFEYDWRRHKVPPKQIAAANPLQFMLLEAADAALEDAGFTDESWDRTRMAVVVGTMFGGEFSNDLQMGLRLPETTRLLRSLLEQRGLSRQNSNAIISAYEKKLLEVMPALIDETGSFTSSTLASRLTKSFNLMGGALALDAGDCSSTTAIVAAIDMLREGSSDAVLCAAGQRYMDLVSFESLSLRGGLAAEQRTLLDWDKDGRVPGEGAVVLVLKRLSDAKAAGNPIRSVIRGAAVSAGRRLGQTAKRVVSQVATSNAVSAGEVSVAEISGACDQRADQTLFETVGLSRGRNKTLAVGAVDGTIGHVGAAGGAAGLIKLSHALSCGQLPATATLNGAHLTEYGLKAMGQSQRLDAVNSDGYRSGTITEMHEDLVGHLLVDNGLPLPQSSPLEKSLDIDMNPRPAGVNTVPASGPRIAALFPGQGSQYAGMLQGLAVDTIEGREALAEIDQLSRQCGQSTLAEVAWREPNRLGSAVWETQWSMYLGDLFAWKVLLKLGFSPDIIASHSFGEFPALAAAGGWSEVTGAKATRGRADAVEQFGPRDGAMLSVQADRVTVEAAIAPLAGRIWRCAENSPQQTVVGGSVRCIDALELLIEPTRMRSKRLAVPSPFHTPLLSEAAEQLAAMLAGLTLSPPKVPIVSSTTLARLQTTEAMRESLTRQMTETVRWLELIEQLYGEGVRVFVEVGPSSVLSSLTRRVLADRADVTIVQFDQRGRAPAEQLSRLKETLRLDRPTGTLNGVVAMPSNVGDGRVLRFDATSRRRERNRSAAQEKFYPSASKSGSQANYPGNGLATQATSGFVNKRDGLIDHEPFSPENVGECTEPVAFERSANRKALASTESGTNSRELEKFLVDFVVEQTGYPVEIVELDADLEADLGIDSIRKAQLFGEIGQRYGLTADDSLSLDEFPTLQHLLDYMLPRVALDMSTEPMEAVITKPNAAAVAESLNGAQATPIYEKSGAVIVQEPSSAASHVTGGLQAELSEFLVNFVVEQTGYPVEIVELDADLEADLGIDSIRKAQLFGEIGQKYGLTADDSLSLDEFPTLQHLLDYMLPRVASDTSPDPTEALITKPHVAVVSGSFNGSQATPMPGKSGAVMVQEPSAAASNATAGLQAELSEFLVNFVVEQTGYPVEIVELDADLEADLGIDSIRKAQLFGEIGQKYDLAADNSLSLDEFPTLRHLLDYMLWVIPGAEASASTTLPGHSVDRDNADTYRSEIFRKGEERGKHNRESIRLWSRMLPSGVADEEQIFPRALGEELDGIAAGAGVSAAAVRAAAANPTALLGGYEMLVSSKGDEVGVVVTFGRQLAPSLKTVETSSGSATQVGIPGMPMALVGWNTSGLVVWIADDGRPENSDRQVATPVAVAVAVVVREANSIDEASGVLKRMAPLNGAINLFAIESASFYRIDANGEMRATTAEICQRPLGRYFRTVCVDGKRSPADIYKCICDTRTGEADRMSAAMHWLAVGWFANHPVVRGGGPVSKWFEEHLIALPSQRATVARPEETQTTVPQVTRRYLLDNEPLSRAAGKRSIDSQQVLVIGEGTVAAAVVEAIVGMGGFPVTVPTDCQHDVEDALAVAEAKGPVLHLVLALAADPMPNSISSTTEQVMTIAFFACQRWIAARREKGEIAEATLTAITRLGGDFGVGGEVSNSAGGGLAGLMKNIAHEFTDLQVRVVDHAVGTPDGTIAKTVAAEIGCPAKVLEVGYGLAGRQQPLLVEAPLVGNDVGLESTVTGSTWLVTGGARGVTAACAVALGRRYGLRLALVGSTRLVPIKAEWLTLDDGGLRELKGQLMIEAKNRGEDPRQAWRGVEKTLEITGSLASCHDSGVEAQYFTCDLANAGDVVRLVAHVEKSMGPIRGLLHGAGYEAACKFEKKTPAGLMATIGPKVLGLEHLLRAIDTNSLCAVIGFGSTSGRFGGHGQADYSLANDLLAKMITKLRHERRIPATVFHWHAWDEVGMASRPESRFVLEQFGLNFMPLEEGVGHFLREISAGLPVAEVVVTESAFSEAAGPVRHLSALTEPQRQKADRCSNALNCGSLVSDVEQSEKADWVKFEFDPSRDRFLLEHTQNGKPLLPAVMAAEVLAQAVRATGLAETVEEIREFKVERPIRFPTSALREVQVQVDPVRDHLIPVTGWSHVLNAAGDPAGEPRPHISGQVVLGPTEAITQKLDEQLFPFNPMIYQEDAQLHHGKAFRTLSGLFLDRSGGWARLTAVDWDELAAPRGARGWTVPIALLDGCIVGCAVYSYILLGKRVEVPLRFERLRIVAPARIGEACTLRLFYRGHDEAESRYDFTLYGDDGRPLLAIDGLHLALVPSSGGK